MCSKCTGLLEGHRSSHRIVDQFHRQKVEYMRLGYAQQSAFNPRESAAQNGGAPRCGCAISGSAPLRLLYGRAIALHSHPTGCGETPFRAGLKKGGRRRIPTKESAV